MNSGLCLIVVHSGELCSQYPLFAVMYLLLPVLGHCSGCNQAQMTATIGLGTPDQGFNGGQGDVCCGNAGGGGGADGPGIGAFTHDRQNNNPANQGSGGPGKLSNITGVVLYYAGGGGGGVWDLQSAAYQIQANLGVSFAF